MPLQLHQRQTGITNSGTVFIILANDSSMTWLVPCSVWCMRSFCHAESYSDHFSSPHPKGSGITAWTLATFFLLPQANQKRVSNMQCRHLPADLPLINVEIEMFGFKAWQTALALKWLLSVFPEVFRLALSSWEIFPSRRYACKSVPRVWAPLILHERSFSLWRVFCGQSNAVPNCYRFS